MPEIEDFPDNDPELQSSIESLIRAAESKDNKMLSKQIQQSYDNIVIQRMDETQWQKMIVYLEQFPRFEATCTDMKAIHEPTNILTLMSVYAICGVVTPIHNIGTAILIASYSPSASSVAISTWGLSVGATFGFVNGVSILLKRDKLNLEKMDAVIRIAGTLIVVGGLTTSAVFLLTQFIMPFLLPQNTALAFSDFYHYFTWSPMAELASMIFPIIIFKRENNYQIQLWSTIFYRLSAVGLQYYFAKIQGAGLKGIGLGGLIAAWVNTFLLGLWFVHRRGIYANYINLSPIAFRHFSDFVKAGLKLALQRLTEWVNLFAITLLLGNLNADGLSAAAPAVQAAVLSALINQYMGMITMMRFEELSPKYKNLLLTTNLIGISFNGILMVFISCFRQNIIDFILGINKSDAINSLANTLLLISAASFIPDGMRLITAGILRGKDDLVYPSLASLALMTVLGVTVGALIGYREDGQYATPLFLLRTVTILLSAMVNYKRCHDKITTVSMGNTWCCLHRSAPILPAITTEANTLNNIT